MPQMTFWASQVPSGITWSYKMDPVDPGRPGSFLVVAHDQAGKSMATGGCLVPPTVLHECVLSLVDESWGTYLFGDPKNLQDGVSAHVQRWRRFAAAERSAARKVRG